MTTRTVTVVAALVVVLVSLSEAFVAPSSRIHPHVLKLEITQLSMARSRPPTVGDYILPDTPPSFGDSSVPDAASEATSQTVSNVAEAVVSTPKEVPTLSEFLKRPDLRFEFRNGVSWEDTSSKVNEKTLIMKQNLASLFGDLPSWDLPSLELPKGAGGMEQVNFGAGTSRLMDSINISEYGMWYVAGLALLLAARQRSAGEGAAKKDYEGKLKVANEKAEEAAEAASVAAKGATLAKKMVNKASVKSDEMLLESTKIQAMQVEKEMMAKELKTLKQETAMLRKQLEEVSKVSMASAPTPKEEAAKQVIPRAPEEDQQILNVIKEKDTENKKNGVKTKKARKKTTKSETPNLFFGEPVEVQPKAKVVEEAAAPDVKKSTTKKAAKKAAKKATTKNAEKASTDWSTLSVSTLKRKTVKDLSAYLADKGVDVKDADGKPKKKDELVSAVQNL